MYNNYLEKELFNNGVYTAWQFIVNTEKTICTAMYCKILILALIRNMGDSHDQWKNDLFAQLINHDGNVKRVSVTTENLPNYDISIVGQEISMPFLLNKLTKDFFQYSRNAFDSMAQVANAGCLAFNAKKVESVDFLNMLKVFQQQTYALAFPTMSAWFNSINKSDEYKYIDAFSNRTKHTCDVYLEVSMAVLGSENKAILNPFYQKGVQQAKQEMSDYLSFVYDFVTEAYQNFLAALKTEIPKRTYAVNRIHKIKIYQQKMKDNSDSNFSIPYINAIGDISSMAHEIQILFLRESEGKFYAKNCSIDTIYIKDPEKDHSYIGKYVAKEVCGDDNLLRYRRYTKILYQEGSLPFVFQAMNDEKQKHILYHANMFMEVTAVSDDDDFIKRVQIPF